MNTKEQTLRHLKWLFATVDVASTKNESDCPYSELRHLFSGMLKQFLSDYFKEDIKFDRKKTFAYLQAHYKGSKIEINAYRAGIILTVEDGNASEITKDFEPVFSAIMGSGPTCSYNYYSTVAKTSYPTTEWNLHPEERLTYIVNGWASCASEFFTDVQDYYYPSIIKSFGEEKILTEEGYQALLSQATNLNVAFYIIHKIQEIYPNIDYTDIYEWSKVDPSKTKQLSA